jgi:hypothetical protein
MTEAMGEGSDGTEKTREQKQIGKQKDYTPDNMFWHHCTIFRPIFRKYICVLPKNCNFGCMSPVI